MRLTRRVETPFEHDAGETVRRAGGSCERDGQATRRYRPSNSGLRFSANAATASV